MTPKYSLNVERCRIVAFGCTHHLSGRYEYEDRAGIKKPSD